MQNIPSLEELEALINKMKKLLSKYESTLKEEEIHNKIKMLEIWMKIYKHGLSAANKISDRGTAWLEELSTNLKISAEELERFSNEGGSNPITTKQAVMVEKFNKSAANIAQTIFKLEKLFSHRNSIINPKEN